MKNALTPDQIKAKGQEFSTRVETLMAVRDMHKRMEPNPKVQNANIHELFAFYNIAFFGGALESNCLLEWSTKMTLCAGICYCENMDKKSGKGLFCTVRLSKPLLLYRTLDDLLETLLHEMIHAWLFLTKDKHTRNDGVDGHGPDFIEKMVEINGVTGLKLSVYHSFHDEVDRCQEHVWLCDGKVCPKKPPYYGVVKRARNMPPGPQDWWFAQHAKDCGGTYIKVLEPKLYEGSTKPITDFVERTKLPTKIQPKKPKRDNNGKENFKEPT